MRHHPLLHSIRIKKIKTLQTGLDRFAFDNKLDFLKSVSDSFMMDNLDLETATFHVAIERMPPLILQFDLDALAQQPILTVVWILLIGMIVFFVSSTILVSCLIRNVYQGKALFQSISTCQCSATNQ